MDPLDSVLNHFSLSADVFFTGNICGNHEFSEDPRRGHLHVIRSGKVTLFIEGQQPSQIWIAEPSLIFLPRPRAHKLLMNSVDGADVVCGTVSFGGGERGPISASLPDVLLIKLDDFKGADVLLGLMYEEAFSGTMGKQALLDRLCQVLIIRMLRHCLSTGATVGGTLAGLSDSRLSRALQAIHALPSYPWTLEEMADQANMSRARFASRFKKVIGETPANYLALWRVMAAQNMLRQGLPIKRVALEVGYGNSSSLTRAFSRSVGVTPMNWLNSQGVASSKA